MVGFAFPQLVGRYKSFSDIEKDPNAELLAFGMDMTVPEFKNLMSKSLAVYTLFNQPVVVTIVDKNESAKEVTLTHEDGTPLLYGDFLIDRSGPAFGGYLFHGVGSSYLEATSTTSKEDRQERANLQLEAAREHAREKLIARGLSDEALTQELEALDPVLQEAANHFAGADTFKRRLSDFDLVAKDLPLLKERLSAAVRDDMRERNPGLSNYREELDDQLVNAVWRYGDTTIRHEDISLAKENYDITYYTKKAMAAPGETITTPSHITKATKVKKPFTHLLTEATRCLVDMDYQAQEGHDHPVKVITDPGMGFEIQGYTFIDEHYIKDRIADINRINEGILTEYTSLYENYLTQGLDRTTAATTALAALRTAHPEIGAISQLHTEISQNSLGSHKEELGDVITTDAPIITQYLAIEPVLNDMDQWLQHNLSNGVYQTQRERILESNPSISRLELIEKLIPSCLDAENSSIRTAVLTARQKQFKAQIQFVHDAHLFEEAGKKLSQAFLFEAIGKDGKIRGNIGDVTPYLQGAQRVAESPNPIEQRYAKANLDITSFSHMVTISQWGIDAENLRQLHEVGSGVTPEAFAHDFSHRSISPHPDGTGARENAGWSTISTEVATKTLKEFQSLNAEFAEKIEQNQELFNLLEQYKTTYNQQLDGKAKGGSKGQDMINRAGFRGELILNGIRSHLTTHLEEQYPHMFAVAREEFGMTNEQIIDTALAKFKTSVEFGVKLARKMEAAQQDVSVSKAATIQEVANATGESLTQSQEVDALVDEIMDIRGFDATTRRFATLKRPNKARQARTTDLDTDPTTIDTAEADLPPTSNRMKEKKEAEAHVAIDLPPPLPDLDNLDAAIHLADNLEQHQSTQAKSEAVTEATTDINRQTVRPAQAKKAADLETVTTATTSLSDLDDSTISTVRATIPTQAKSEAVAEATTDINRQTVHPAQAKKAVDLETVTTATTSLSDLDDSTISTVRATIPTPPTQPDPVRSPTTTPNVASSETTIGTRSTEATPSHTTNPATVSQQTRTQQPTVSTTIDSASTQPFPRQPTKTQSTNPTTTAPPFQLTEPSSQNPPVATKVTQPTKKELKQQRQADEDRLFRKKQEEYGPDPTSDNIVRNSMIAGIVLLVAALTFGAPLAVAGLVALGYAAKHKNDVENNGPNRTAAKKEAQAIFETRLATVEEQNITREYSDIEHTASRNSMNPPPLTTTLTPSRPAPHLNTGQTPHPISGNTILDTIVRTATEATAFVQSIPPTLATNMGPQLGNEALHTTQQRQGRISPQLENAAREAAAPARDQIQAVENTAITSPIATAKGQKPEGPPSAGRF